MSVRQKKPRIKLNSKAYMALKNQVLERDSWKCQECGALENLQVHHLKSRSRLGNDEMINLITLCTPCHRKKHTR
jgi:5-methylcytosine-specific restriction endonuclease McrA